MSPKIEVEIAAVVDAVLRSARVPEPSRSDIGDELSGHLRDACHGALCRGKSEDEAMEEALLRFGDPALLTRALRRRVLRHDLGEARMAMARDEIVWWAFECLSLSVLVHAHGGLVGEQDVTWTGSLGFGAYLFVASLLLFFWVRLLIARVRHRAPDRSIGSRAAAWAGLFSANAIVFAGMVLMLPLVIASCGLDGGALGGISAVSVDLGALAARMTASAAIFLVGLPTLLALGAEAAASHRLTGR
ncbi:MAG: permease prefix domain 1-containing protein [Acidobacteriota bacterium]